MTDRLIQKRGAPGDRGEPNPIDTPPPREYICIVGGPTNTFNGYYTTIELREGTPTPSSVPRRYDIHGEEIVPFLRQQWYREDDRTIFTGGPRPRNRGDLKYYRDFEPLPVDVKPEDDFEAWRRNGWSANAVYELQQRMWKASDTDSWQAGTHDKYWANFVDPAARLYRNPGDLPEPLKRPKPRRGDIVTFLVYAPAYELRQKVDWDASNHNPIHRDKAGVRAAPAAGPKKAAGKLAKQNLPNGYASMSLREKAELLQQCAEAAGHRVAVEEAEQVLLWQAERLEVLL